MAEKAELIHASIGGREVRIRWRLARHGEWLAWCYVPGPGGLPNEGVGFEARAASPDEAVETVRAKVAAYLGEA